MLKLAAGGWMVVGSCSFRLSLLPFVLSSVLLWRAIERNVTFHLKMSSEASRLGES